MPKGKRKNWKEIQRERQNKQTQSQEEHRKLMEHKAKHKPRKLPKAKLLFGIILIAIILGSYSIRQYVEGQKPPTIGDNTGNIAPGGPAPDFTFYDLDGKLITLSQFTDKVIGIHFMAVGCGGQLYEVNQYQLAQIKGVCSNFCSDKPVAFLTVAVATCENSALEDIRNNYGVTWKIGNDFADRTLDIVDTYVPLGIGDGSVVLIDKEFNIAEVYRGGVAASTLNSEINELLED